MSRETILDDAIAKAKEAEDWQLADWLRMARGGESAARWYAAKLHELTEENGKLRKLVADMYEAMWHVSETWTEDVCADRMHELGIEAGK